MMKTTSRPIKTLLLMAAVLFLVPVQGAFAAKKAKTIFQGKAYCRTKATVVSTLDGTLVEVPYTVGDPVQKDETIAKVRIKKAEQIEMQESVVIDSKLNQIKMRIAQYEAEIAQLAPKKAEQELLVNDNLATPVVLEEIRKKEAQIAKQIKFLKGDIAELRRGRSVRLKAISANMGQPIKGTRIPDTAFIPAPTTGTVIYVFPDIRAGEEIKIKDKLMTIGFMEVMVIRSQVFEFEAAKLKVGDTAKVKLKHNKETFPATVTNIAWTPVDTKYQAPSYYEVELEVQNPDYAIKEGYKVEIDFDTLH